jgi:hypothetical protein
MAETARRIVCEIKAIFLVTMVCLSCIGWTKNARKLVHMENTPENHNERVVRMVGVPVVPIGVMCGWF